MDITHDEKAVLKLYCDQWSYENCGAIMNLVIEDVFENPMNRIIFQKAQQIRNKGLVPDMILLGKEVMPYTPQYKNIIHEVAKLSFDIPMLLNANAIVMNLFDKYANRILKADVARIMITDEGNDCIDNIQQLKVTIARIEDVINTLDVSESTEDLVFKTMQSIYKGHESKEAHNGLKTGILSLDNQTMGLLKGLVYVIGARPGMGKTSLVKKIIHQNCIIDKKKVLIVSGEETEEQLITGLLSLMTEIDSTKIRKNQCSTVELNIINNASKTIQNNLIIEAKGSVTWQKVERLVKQHNPDITIVDYLQIMTSEPSDGKNLTPEQRLSIICNRLANLAKEHKTAMVELSQLSREVEKRQPPRPILSDMKDSGAIEANAVQVWLMYRPDYYSANPRDKGGADLSGLCEINIAKNRYGAIGRTYARFIPQFAKFEDCEPITPTENIGGNTNDISTNNDIPVF